MRLLTHLSLTLSLLAFAGCTRYDSKPSSTETERRREAEEKAKIDVDSAARKTGKAAHEIVDESRDLAKKAGRKLKETGQEVKEGWKEADRQKREPEKK